MVRSPRLVTLCSIRNGVIFVVNAGVGIHRLRSKIDDAVREVAHTPVEHGIRMLHFGPAVTPVIFDRGFRSLHQIIDHSVA